jgi:hypothetical protein
MAATRQPLTGAPSHESPPSSVRFDWIMVLFTIWGIGGLFLDGWAHAHFPQLETFFTPWHAVLYSGYLAIAATLVITTLRNLQQAASGDKASGATPSLVTLIRNNARGFHWLEAVPAGYGLSLLGVGLFAVSGVGDLSWHLLFGIERSVDALLSPTHLGLALGGGLAATGPLRAAWRRRDGVDAYSWRQLGPAIISLITTLSLLTFFTEYASPFVDPWPIYPASFLAGYGPAMGITDILLYTGLLMSFVLLAMRRWRLPMGVFTLIFTLNTGLMAVFNPEVVVFLLPCALLGGLAADLLYQRLQPSEQRLERMRLFAFAVPSILYLFYFLDLAIVGPLRFQSGISWSVHFWVGSIVLAGLVGFLLSYVMFPPLTPIEKQEEPLP